MIVFCTLVPCFGIRECYFLLHGVRIFNKQGMGDISYCLLIAVSQYLMFIGIDDQCFQRQASIICLTACFTSFHIISRYAILYYTGIIVNCFADKVSAWQTVNDTGDFITVHRHRNNEYTLCRNVILDITGIIILCSCIAVRIHACHGEFEGISLNILFDNVIIVGIIRTRCIHDLDIDVFTGRFSLCMIIACIDFECQFLGSIQIGGICIRLSV